MTQKKQFPPIDGSVRVLPGLLDFHAEHNPDFPCYAFPSREDPAVEAQVTYAEYAQATHRVAHIVRPGRKGPEGQVVAVLINCDTLAYLTLITGMVRAGLVPFPMSPRNPAEAVFSMLEKTKCHRIISQPSLSNVMTSLKSICDSKGYKLQAHNLPSLKEFFPTIGISSSVQPYPRGNVVESRKDILLYLHSSGSTGHPKPIPQSQEVLTQWVTNEAVKNVRRPDLKHFTGLLPSFHTLGIVLQLLAANLNTEPIGLFTPMDPEPPVIPNPRNVLDTVKTLKCSAIAAVPAFLEAWANSEEALQYLTTLRYVAFSGGPLSDKNAQKCIEAGVPLTTVYGSTECGAVMMSANSAKYGMQWMSMMSGTKPRWVSQDDGSYELQLLTCDTHQLAVENLPDVKGYATSDLFEPHPTEKGLWRIVGRTDDVIVLGSGEKIVPLAQEGHLASTPYVAGVVMFGRERSQPGVLIEPSAEHVVPAGDNDALVKFRETLWPWVAEANKAAPSFARIFKEMIIVTDPAKPMARAGKGTVQRKRTLAIYAKEIDQLYDTVQQSEDANGIAPPASWTAENIEKWLRQHAEAIMTGDNQSLTSSVDLFDIGFDSLSATYLRNRILGALRTATDPAAKNASGNVPQDLVFANPTLHNLAVAVFKLIHPDMANGVSKHEQDSSLVEQMITKYSADFPVFKRGISHRSDIVVLLTGSTGNLGSHVLASLLSDKRVTKVFTLNRPSSRQDRQKSAFIDGKFPLGLLQSEALTALVGDVSRTDLGLDAQTFAEIKASVTHIIHVAWRLDFNISLSSYEGLVAGARNLVNVSAECKNPVQFLFTSSVSAAVGWDAQNGPVPEQVLPSAGVAAGMGYGASKYVVERILDNASKRGLDSTTFRIGQVCGSPSSGAWNTTDWVPIIVKSSQVLGCLPSQDDDVAWITMDTAAHTITDVVFSATEHPNPLLVNLVHPHRVPWNTIFQSISDALPKPLPLVPFTDWLAMVESASEDPSASNLDRIPAIKLLKFLHAVGSGTKAQVFSTNLAQLVSPSLDHADAIDAYTARSWVEYWKGKGFLN